MIKIFFFDHPAQLRRHSSGVLFGPCSTPPAGSLAGALAVPAKALSSTSALRRLIRHIQQSLLGLLNPLQGRFVLQVEKYPLGIIPPSTGKCDSIPDEAPGRRSKAVRSPWHLATAGVPCASADCRSLQTPAPAPIQRFHLLRTYTRPARAAPTDSSRIRQANPSANTQAL